MTSELLSGRRSRKRSGWREWRRGTWRRRGLSTRVSPSPVDAGVSIGKGVLTVEDLFHIYYDSTYFPYEIVLTRDDEDAGAVGQRYMLYVSVIPGATPQNLCLPNIIRTRHGSCIMYHVSPGSSRAPDHCTIALIPKGKCCTEPSLTRTAPSLPLHCHPASTHHPLSFFAAATSAPSVFLSVRATHSPLTSRHSALRVQRQTTPLLVCSQVLEEEEGPAKLLSPDDLFGSQRGALPALHIVLSEKDRIGVE